MGPNSTRLEVARALFADSGIAHFGVADGAPWRHVHPGCKSVIVFASGHELWPALRRRRDTGHNFGPQPIDAHTRRCVDAALRHWAEPTWVVCAMDDPVQPDFRRLAIEAGLGHRSRLELVIHPVVGPWLGLRAACFTRERLPTTGPLESASPCEGCGAPCADACPGDAVGERFNLGACAAERERSAGCRSRCDARLACPVGHEHRYGALQHRYHHSFGGRPALADCLDEP